MLCPVKDASTHPVYITVTEIEHNIKDKTLEISCKLFMDDFEQALRKTTSSKVDLQSSAQKKEMHVLVNKYLLNHLQLKVDGKSVSITFLGFEKEEEGIFCYLQVDRIEKVQELVVTDNLLYEYKSEQLSLIHVTVNNNRKSTKLNNPADKAVFRF